MRTFTRTDFKIVLKVSDPTLVGVCKTIYSCRTILRKGQKIITNFPMVLW